MLVKPNIEKVKAMLPEINIHEEIGSGGFKIVYRAEISGNLEALKLVQIPIDPENNEVKEENLKRVYREIDVLEKCRSPFLVRLGSLSRRELEIQEYHYVLYSEELIPGQSLKQLVNSGIHPDYLELHSLAKCLLIAVQELSGMNIIHRDIKPGNIIKTENFKRPFVLLDLGIAFQVGGTPITHDSHNIPGSLYYIAPEMLDNGFRNNLDFRADLYTIGLVLYEYASGLNPFTKKGDDQFSTLYRIKTRKPEPLFELRKDLPVVFCSIIDRLLRKLPALRPANISKIIEEMENIQ